ncbi:hypothetical protein [Vibrio alginolyticus]|uniref:hypothetical protein n=1 Tax=Vibrio TaxID=662 RepID=UPI0006CA729F|nr:hypothetical protein [Vibrio alginolyticus]KPM98479.1 hypothetical protein AOG25_08520 [Vibrio alginolyticus]CAH7143514.1 conserved hypothetical protein [Vibrio chagasii]CAH7234595.1 conserved hypothetical protein [Vibrio chagasii]
MSNNLGFTPINQEEIFKSSPNLEKVLCRFENHELNFKETSSPSLSSNENDIHLQGTFTDPSNTSFIDFELVTDYLASKSDLITTIRPSTVDVWGKSEFEPTVHHNLSASELNNSLKTQLCSAPSELTVNPSKELDTSIKATQEHIQKINEDLERKQSIQMTNSPPSDDFAKRASGRAKWNNL